MGPGSSGQRAALSSVSAEKQAAGPATLEEMSALVDMEEYQALEEAFMKKVMPPSSSQR